MTLTPNPIAVRALAIARAQIGKPYVWGASGPSSFDCSGLVVYSYRTAGRYLARLNDAGLALAGVRITQAGLLPGDLVRPHVGHIQIYAGGGRIVEAANASVPVREVPMWGFLDGTRIMPAIPPVVVHSRLLQLATPYMVGADVRAVQARVGALVDGSFGPATQAAVVAFQRRYWPHDASQWDGKVGPLTCRALGIAWVA
jgi:peptidoglycan hydrolase-like protein with peptidoglycan-binding domain